MTRDHQQRDERRETRRIQLLDDAIEGIREVGPGVTMEQLARRGGVTKPILYRHFRDREGLITAIADRFSAELLSSVEATLAAETVPRERLESTVDGYLAFIEQEPSLYRFILQQVATPVAGIPRLNPLIATIARQVAVVIGEELRSRGFDSGAAVPWGYGIVGLVHQAGDWWLDDRTLPRARLTGYLTSLLWDGLAVAATAGPGVIPGAARHVGWGTRPEGAEREEASP